MIAVLQWLRRLFTGGDGEIAEEMDSDDAVLRSGGLAYYKWGTGTIRFRGLSAVGRRSPAEVATDIIRQQSMWEGDVGFRRTVTYLHELVHYLQDLTTGVGHWDFLQRQVAYADLMPVIVTQYAAASQATRADPSRYNEMIARSIFNCWPEADHSRERDCLIAAARANGWHPAEDFADLFSMASILETEAVLQTVVTVMRTQISAKAGKIMADNISIFDPLKMEEKYSALCQFILRHTMHALGVKDTKEFLATIGNTDIDLARLYHLYIFLIDLACAHPPPRFFDETAPTVDDFLPGVRLMRYMFALQKGLPDDADNVLTLEKRLNQACGIAYPTVSEVYRMWADDFAAQPQTPAVKVRGANATERITSKDAFAKIANGVAVTGLPVVYAVAGERGTFSLRLNAHKWSDQYRYLDDSAAWDGIFLECLGAFYTPRPFRCTVTLSCPVCRKGCLEGFELPCEVPRDEDCVVHAYFAEEAARRDHGGDHG